MIKMKNFYNESRKSQPDVFITFLESSIKILNDIKFCWFTFLFTKTSETIYLLEREVRNYVKFYFSAKFENYW